MNVPFQAKAGTTRLLGRFLRLLLPIFVIASIGALSIVAGRSFGDERNVLATHVGNVAARMVTAINRLPQDTASTQVESLLAVALADSAISCLSIVNSSGIARVSAPPRIGCSGSDFDAEVKLPLAQDGHSLLIRYSRKELETRSDVVRNFTLLALLCSLVIAALASLLSFSAVVGRPVKALLTAIEQTRLTSKPVLVTEQPEDELGEVISAFNDMQARMDEQTTELTKALQHISQQAVTDHLTGLNNRTALTEHLSKLHSKWFELRNNASVLFIDLDNFKPINDNFGHESGDLILQKVAKRFLAAIPDGAFMARIGGDEFVIVLQHDDAVDVAEAVLTTLEKPFQLGKMSVNLGASIGICSFKEAASCDDIVKLADMAMYKAKETGKNRIAMVEREALKQAS